MRSLLFLLLLCVSLPLFAQNSTQDKQPAVQASLLSTQTFKVSGNCGMCKKKIEAPFKEMNGIESATWDKKNKTFTVTFNGNIVTEQTIKETIAAQGYDTDTIKASDEAYNKLPKCCRYRDRSHD